MRITEVKCFSCERGSVKSLHNHHPDNCFVVRDLKVIRGNEGLFVAMPSKKRKDGQFKDIAHP
jgi:stage V sporulation protein G